VTNSGPQGSGAKPPSLETRAQKSCVLKLYSQIKYSLHITQHWRRLPVYPTARFLTFRLKTEIKDWVGQGNTEWTAFVHAESRWGLLHCVSSDRPWSQWAADDGIRKKCVYIWIPAGGSDIYLQTSTNQNLENPDPKYICIAVYRHWTQGNALSFWKAEWSANKESAISR
jgi:hypothetical protein